MAEEGRPIAADADAQAARPELAEVVGEKPKKKAKKKTASGGK